MKRRHKWESTAMETGFSDTARCTRCGVTRAYRLTFGVMGRLVFWRYEWPDGRTEDLSTRDSVPPCRAAVARWAYVEARSTLGAGLKERQKNERAAYKRLSNMR